MLMTARDTAAGSDITEADQDGVFVDGDVALFEVEQPPFITVGQFHSERLDALSPPKKLVSDWNSAIHGNSLVTAWKETNYEERYFDYITSDMAASKQVEQIEDKMEESDVCIISGSRLWPLCPRRMLYEHITGEEVDNAIIN